MLLILIFALVFHFVSDILSQTQKQILCKNNNLKILLSHVLIYSIYMTLPLVVIQFFNSYLTTDRFQSILILSSTFFVLMFSSHFIIDYLIGKLLTMYLEKNWSHKLKLIIIYIDQLLHIFVLIITLYYLLFI